MRQGDVSRKRRFRNGAPWYAAHRATRFSLRMLAYQRNIFEAAALTIRRMRNGRTGP
jgi:hypothetical protein